MDYDFKSVSHSAFFFVTLLQFECNLNLIYAEFSKKLLIQKTTVEKVVKFCQAAIVF